MSTTLEQWVEKLHLIDAFTETRDFVDFSEEDQNKIMATKQGHYQEVIFKLKADFERKYTQNPQSDPVEKMREYKFLAILGQGAFGLVKLVEHQPTSKFYALKIVAKDKVVRSRQIPHTMNEKRILNSIKYPFVVHLNFSMKDKGYLYFGMPFINGGELFTHLRKAKKFDEHQARFYGAQVCLGLEYIHKMGLIYRDLKPENIMVTYRGYLKITDFGFCKILKDRTYTMCGTPEYIAPEIIQSKGYGTSVDWWSYGILIYELCAGYSPFAVGDPEQMVMMERIVSGKFKMPSYFSNDLKSFIGNILQTDLTKRFGNLKNGVDDIKSHVWFKSVNWWNLYNRNVDVPFVPQVSGPGDYSQFDKYDDVQMRLVEVDKYEKEFADF